MRWFRGAGCIGKKICCTGKLRSEVIIRLILNMENASHAHSLVQSLSNVVNDIALIGEYRRCYKKECSNLTRRVKLLAPLFEELRELRFPLPEEVALCFHNLEKALYSAKQLLRLCHDGSKLFLVLEREAVASRFQEVTSDLSRALDGLPLDLLDVADEIREQVELVHTQFKRAKGRVDIQDLQLTIDILAVLSAKGTGENDPVVLERLADALELKSMSDVRQEYKSLQGLERGGEVEESVDNMFYILNCIRTVAMIDSISPEPHNQERPRQVGVSEKFSSAEIPEDFRCPISLELMKDPVILATGQTYERTCIEKWLDEGNRTCPTTQIMLPHLSLTPNYVLRSLIAQWCESNGVEVPRKPGSSCMGKLNGHPPADLFGDAAAVEALLLKLSMGQADEQRAAAGDLRLLAKRSVDNRICIAKAGAIPLLVNLLSTRDLKTQEHAVTALLNLSINDNNKGAIVLAGAINPIVEVLKNGSMEARENAAATLFSLSVVDENKVTIGASGAIPALVDLLRFGTARGKKDAATALFNLSIYQGNKAKAVRAGVVPPLMKFLEDSGAGMLDGALAILAVLATHQEGQVAIASAKAVPILIDIIRSGSPRNRENAAAVLLALSSCDPSHMTLARQLGAIAPLNDLARSGTQRARRKATQLLEHLKKQDQATYNVVNVQ